MYHFPLADINLKVGPPFCSPCNYIQSAWKTSWRSQEQIQLAYACCRLQYTLMLLYNCIPPGTSIRLSGKPKVGNSKLVIAQVYYVVVAERLCFIATSIVAWHAHVRHTYLMQHETYGCRSGLTAGTCGCCRQQPLHLPKLPFIW